MKGQGFPLAWPPGWKRTPAHLRGYGKFGFRGQGVTVDQACARVLLELGRMGVADYNVIVSSNLQLRRDGLPRSDQANPADPGACVYWSDGAAERCMAIDQYSRVGDNIAAIAATINAMRAIERHGGAQILDRAFSGFTALPAPGQTSRTWMDVLGFPRGAVVSLDDAKAAYRRLSGIHHPDKGGTEAAMAELNNAWSQAQEEFRGL